MDNNKIKLSKNNLLYFIMLMLLTEVTYEDSKNNIEISSTKFTKRFGKF